MKLRDIFKKDVDEFTRGVKSGILLGIAIMYFMMAIALIIKSLI